MSKRVQQVHPNGCVVAALAMVTGEDYDIVHDRMQSLVFTWDGDKCTPGKDLNIYGLNFENDGVAYLSAYGFAIQRYYKIQSDNVPRKDWPLLWVKDLDGFCGYIALTVLNAKCHAVYVDKDGTVYDPFREGTFSLQHDYEDCYQIIAVFKLRGWPND